MLPERWRRYAHAWGRMCWRAGPDFCAADIGEALAEELAARDETLMEDYLVRGYDAQAARERGAALVRAGLVCPAVVGAALNGTGVDTLLNVLAAFCAAPQEEAGDALFPRPCVQGAS